MGPQVQPKCFWHAQHMRNNWELRKRGYLIRFGHKEALLLEKRTLNGHFSRPAETDPYVLFCRSPNQYNFFALCSNYFFKWFCKISLPKTFGLLDDWDVDFSIWLGFNGKDNSNKSDRAQKWGSVIEYSSNMWQPQTHTYSYTNTIC